MCFHPPQEHFLIPSNKPSTPLKENRVCLQLECPNPKYVPQPACTRPGRGREILHSVSRTTRWDSFHAELPKSDGRPRQVTGKQGPCTRGMQHEEPAQGTMRGSQKKWELILWLKWSQEASHEVCRLGALSASYLLLVKRCLAIYMWPWWAEVVLLSPPDLTWLCTVQGQLCRD